MRYNYGLQHRNLVKIYSDILSLPKKEREMLKNWKNPNLNMSDIPSGSFIGTLINILNTRCNSYSNMTINDANNFLDQLNIANNSDEKFSLFSNIILSSSIIEQKWLISIILKDLKLNIGHEVIFDIFHPKASEVYKSTSSLLEVCNFIEKPDDSKYLNNLYRINLPIRPMLADRMTLHQIINNFVNITVLAETKFDGERIQCHYNQGEIKFFTRNAVDYTNLYYPKIGSYLKNNIFAKAAILDGEIVVWDKLLQKFAAFGENKTVANLKESESEEKDIVYMVFDIIYLITPSGKEHSLQNVILSDRKKILKTIIKEIPQKFEIIQGIECNNIEEIFKRFNESIENNEEGIIIKKTDSLYKLDDRSKDWVKMKCDYIDSLVDTLDLIIIGAYFGEGRRTNNYSHDLHNNITSFLMGVIKNYDKDDCRNSIILPFVKVGTGYSQDELEKIRSKMCNNLMIFEERQPPKYFGGWKFFGKDKPDLIINDINDSIILEVKAAEIITSDSFPTKLTLRFPRVVRIRYDKDIKNAMRYEEVLDFYQNFQHNHLIKKKKKIDLEDIQEKENKNDKKLKKLGKRIIKFSRVQEDFKDTDTSKIVKKSELLKNYEFLIINISENITKNLEEKKIMENLIIENGGRKIQNFLNSTTHIIANKLDVRALNILKKEDINIYKPKWLLDCIKYKKIIPISPVYLSYINKKTQEYFLNTIDIFGDAYFEDLDENQLNDIYINIKIPLNLSDHSQENEKMNHISENRLTLNDCEYSRILENLKKEYKDEWIKNFK